MIRLRRELRRPVRANLAVETQCPPSFVARASRRVAASAMVSSLECTSIGRRRILNELPLFRRRRALLQRVPLMCRDEPDAFRLAQRHRAVERGIYLKKVESGTRHRSDH